MFILQWGFAECQFVFLVFFYEDFSDNWPPEKETILPGKLLDGTDLEVVVAVDKIAATAVELVKVFSRLMPTTCGLISVLEGAGAEPAKFVILQSKK